MSVPKTETEVKNVAVKDNNVSAIIIVNIEIMIPDFFGVCVRCMTFNHAKYIEDTMNGFTMQETHFPFICTIIDDASTDGEQEIIRKYLQEHFDLEDKAIVRNEETDDYVMTFAKHKTNKNCYFAVLYLKYNHYDNISKKRRKLQYIAEWNDNAKYIAPCEGDDFWTSSSKLQEQVDIFEKNESVTLVYSDYETVDEQGNPIYRPIYEKYKSYSTSGDILPILFKTNFPLTLTTMIRKDVFDTEVYRNRPASLDYMSFVASAFMGDAVYIPKKTGAYRFSPKGAMETKQDLITDAYRKIHPYIYMEYAKGHAIKKSRKSDHSIKRTISKRVTRKQMMDIVKVNKSFIPYFLYELALRAKRRFCSHIKNKISKIFKSKIIFTI